MKKIAVCGSMTFSQKMIDVKQVLEKDGWEVVLPDGVEKYIDGKLEKMLKAGWNPSVEGAKRKIKHDLIRRHYEEIKKSDAVLVINEDKKGIKNYVGGNTFLEMGFAHVLNKKIFILNTLPKSQEMIYQELAAMQPIILEGNLELLQSRQ